FSRDWSSDVCSSDLGLRAFDELGQVAFDLLKGEAAQGIVSAELHDDDLRSMYLKRSRQACLRAARRFAARAGIRHTVSVPFFRQPAFEQRDPGRFHVDAVTRAEAIPDDQDDGLICRVLCV